MICSEDLFIHRRYYTAPLNAVECSILEWAFPMFGSQLFSYNETIATNTTLGEALNATVRAYPMLNKAKLRTELSLIHENAEFKGCCGALALCQVLQR